jgi:nitroreductase
MELNEVLKQRRSIRHYALRKVSLQKVSEICEAALYTPMAGNIYTVRIILVSDKKKIKLLANASQQPFIAEAEYIIAVYSKKDHAIRSYGKRAEDYVRQQAGAAIENMILKTVDMGLGTCWVGWFDEDAVKRILFLPDWAQVEALLPVGYPLEKPIVRKKPDLKLITYFERFKQEEKKKPRNVFD